ncbi:hypothetical protein AC1031_015084 [Aphanomyces cochlioides]|nr:hypothetical protein AC1031_015084 [Aphanomyces cochlioides]
MCRLCIGSSSNIGTYWATRIKFSVAIRYLRVICRADVSLDSDAELKSLALDRWGFIHTPSMGFAYFLNPKYGTRGMYIDADGKRDLHEVMNLLPKCIINSRGLASSKKTVVQEIKDYMSFVAHATGDQSNLIKQLDPYAWWGSIGVEKFPTLAAAAAILLKIPTSQAASERVWSINDFIHSKCRNRLSVDKASKLVILYANARVIKKERNIVDICAGAASDHDSMSDNDEDDTSSAKDASDIEEVKLD